MLWKGMYELLVVVLGTQINMTGIDRAAKLRTQCLEQTLKNEETWKTWFGLVSPHWASSFRDEYAYTSKRSNRCAVQAWKPILECNHRTRDTSFARKCCRWTSSGIEATLQPQLEKNMAGKANNEKRSLLSNSSSWKCQTTYFLESLQRLETKKGGSSVCTARHSILSNSSNCDCHANYFRGPLQRF